MRIVTETPLPGVGVRYEFVTEDGARVGVVHHRSGMRELVLFERKDPDTSHDLVRLSADDSRALAELLLGGDPCHRRVQVKLIHRRATGQAVDRQRCRCGDADAEHQPCLGNTIAE